MDEANIFNKNVSYKLDLIKREYEEIQRIIGRIDNLRFLVMGWCITVWAGLIALVFTRKSFDARFLAIIIGIVSLFAFIDIGYKGFQEQYRKRIGLLEDVLNGVDFSNVEILQALLEVKSPAINDALYNLTFKFIKSILSIIVYRPFAYMLYIGLIILSIIIYRSI